MHLLQSNNALRMKTVAIIYVSIKNIHALRMSATTNNGSFAKANKHLIYRRKLTRKSLMYLIRKPIVIAFFRRPI